MKTYQLKKIIISNNLSLAITELSKHIQELDIEKFPITFKNAKQKELEVLQHDLVSIARRESTGTLDKNFVKEERQFIENELLRILSLCPQDVEPEVEIIKKAGVAPKATSQNTVLLGLAGAAMTFMLIFGIWSLVNWTKSNTPEVIVNTIDTPSSFDSNASTSIKPVKDTAKHNATFNNQ